MITRLLRVGRTARTGGGVIFNPSLLSGLSGAPNIALCRSLGLLWQDAGKTTLATADTDVVRVVKCPFTGLEYTAPADGNRAILNTSGGLWYLTFDGIDDCYDFTAIAGKPLSAHFVYRPSNAGGAGTGLTGGSNSFKFRLHDSTHPNAGKADVYNWTAATVTLSNGTDYVVGINFGSSGAANYWVNGAIEATADPDTSDDSFTVTSGRIGNKTGAGGDPFAGRIYGWAIYTQMQASGLHDLHTYLGALAGLAL